MPTLMSKTQGLRKVAAGDEAEFEQAFASIAHTVLKNKAPGLLDYEVGFQILERDEDDGRAVGIFGFQVGPQWLYAPVFFLNGQLKGTELLWVKDRDMFVPMKENWINRLASNRPVVLGKEVSRNSSSLGLIAPDLQMYTRPPTKYGSTTLPGWLAPAVEAFAYHATRDPRKDIQQVDLSSFLKSAGVNTVQYLINTCQQYPKYAQAFEKFHPGLLREVIDHYKEQVRPLGILEKDADVLSPIAVSKPDAPKDQLAAVKKKYKPKAAPGFPSVLKTGGILDDEAPDAAAADLKTPGAVTMITRDDMELHSDLTDSEREQLKDEGVVFRDHRPESSVAYRVETTQHLCTPSKTGVYKALVKDGTFAKCLVVTAPYSSTERAKFAVVVGLTDSTPRSWILTPTSEITVKDQEDMPDAYDEWLKGLPDAHTTELREDGHYMLVGPDGNGSLPFCVEDGGSTDGDMRCYRADFERRTDYWRNHDPRGRTDRLTAGADSRSPYAFKGWRANDRVCITGKVGGAMRATGNSLYVPSGFKVLTLQEPADEKEKGDKGILHAEPHLPSQESLPPPIVLGSVRDLTQAISEKFAALRVGTDGTEMLINGYRCDKQQALARLIGVIGLREKAARQIISEAKTYESQTYRVKHAAPDDYPLQRSAPGAASFPDQPLTSDYMGMGSSNVELPLNANVSNQLQSEGKRTGPLQDLVTAETQSQAGGSPMQMAMMGAQTGQKEVFDTATLSALLKQTRDDSMIDRHLPHIMDTMSRYGTMLFSFYWNYDRWVDRFGKSDAPVIEDSLRNLFVDTGDAILALEDQSMDMPGSVPGAELDEVAA